MNAARHYPECARLFILVLDVNISHDDGFSAKPITYEKNAVALGWHRQIELFTQGCVVLKVRTSGRNVCVLHPLTVLARPLRGAST